MKAFLLEHRNVLITGIAGAAMIAGSAFFTYEAYQKNARVFSDLQAVSSRLADIHKSVPSPTSENLAELRRQKQEAFEALEKLTSDVRALDLPLAPLTPPEFQKTLNEKAQSLKKLADDNSVQIPQNFYLDFDRYSKSVPKAEITPQLGRQIQVAAVLLESLLQTVPAELKSFKRTELDAERSPSPGGKDTTPAKDASKDKGKPTEKSKVPPEGPQSPLAGQSFEIQFVTRPSNLREFLNSLSSLKSSFVVTRSVKIENEKQKGPSKRPAEPDLLGGNPATGSPAGAASVFGVAQSPAPVGTAPQSEGTSGHRNGEVGQFILGDEKIEVTMRVEFVYFAETASPSL